MQVHETLFDGRMQFTVFQWTLIVWILAASDSAWSKGSIMMRRCCQYLPDSATYIGRMFSSTKSDSLKASIRPSGLFGHIPGYGVVFLIFVLVVCLHQPSEWHRCILLLSQCHYHSYVEELLDSEETEASVQPTAFITDCSKCKHAGMHSESPVTGFLTIQPWADLQIELSHLISESSTLCDLAHIRVFLAWSPFTLL